ncbi:GDSL-type esterase/lipase family protein [Alloscardovia criceti]|uniref:GDSL-type esterase/lipase family protein n=1 Tax=Alloscardovia criceti TaxID=356828 RepID=UPI00036852CB|nr:GDSL-type esterase/lipase family protein [Alloscardovia criceti]
MTFISPADARLTYMGRIDTTNPRAQVWVFPYTQVRFRCTGTSLKIRVKNRLHYGQSYLGVIIDGRESKVALPQTECIEDVLLADNLPDIEHEVVIFKRQDGQHYVEFYGLLIDDHAVLTATPQAQSHRRIEIFGDSISCGERNEALLYAGQADPDVDLSSYSNAWWSYGAIAARALGAALHDVSQGGAALYDSIGWFHEPDYIGMESIWDRIEYNPTLGSTRAWDFQQYIPQVVVVALGQNDAHPVDFMAQNCESAQSQHWRARYRAFLQALLAQYPHTHIVCATSIMTHDEAWDRAIATVISELHHPQISQLMYTRNAHATPGHPRIAEHKEMAEQLVAHIESLSPRIWDN